MSKYIDAEKLIKAIEDKGLDCSFALKMERLDTLALIDELQQEHPAKRGYKDCNGCEYNRLLKDQIGWQFRGCFGGDYKGKPIAEIELCPLKLAVQQEQPEVDLEKTVEFECIGKKVKMTVQELINYYIDTECCDVADECGFGRKKGGREMTKAEEKEAILFGKVEVLNPHFKTISVNTEQLNARLKQFDEGAKVLVYIEARKEE